MNFNNTLTSHIGSSSQLSVTYSFSMITCQMLIADLWGVVYNSMTLFCARSIKAKAHEKLPLFSLCRETKSPTVQLNVTD